MGAWNRRVCALTLSTILLLQITSILILTPAYGIHQTQKEVWQIVVVSHEPACTVYHYQLAQKYQIITEEYFKLYEFDTSHYQPECYSIENFEWKYQEPDDLDLLILIYDRDLGRENLHPLGMGGFYSHSGGDITNNHTIIFCECSSFGYSDPPWILSHELSHYILNYLGFDLSRVEDQIHFVDNMYDYCMEEKYDETCKSIGVYIEHEDLASKVKVMIPYQSAIGLSPFNQTLDELELNSKELELFKEITKWWSIGKISNSEYSNSFQILTGQSFNNISSGSYLNESAPVILAEPSKAEKVNPESDVANYSPKDILKSFPILEDWNPSPILSGEYPDWFKTRALLWSSGKISDDGFVKSIDSLKKSLIDIPDLPEKASTAKQEIPDWMKNNAGWWADGLISEEEFVNGIKFLVEKGIIVV